MDHHFTGLLQLRNATIQTVPGVFQCQSSIQSRPAHQIPAIPVASAAFESPDQYTMKRPLYFVFPMSLAICRRHYFILTVQRLCAFAAFKINSSEIRFSSRGRIQPSMSVRSISPVSFSTECTDPADDEALRLRRGSPPHSSRRTSIHRDRHQRWLAAFRIRAIPHK